jgi:hypothetical protein
MPRANLGKFVPPDWRDANQYRHLLDLDGAGWAWEWLRRHTGYLGDEAEESSFALGQSVRSGLVVISAGANAVSNRWGLCFCPVTKLPCHAGAVALGRAV